MAEKARLVFSDVKILQHAQRWYRGNIYRVAGGLVTEVEFFRVEGSKSVPDGKVTGPWVEGRPLRGAAARANRIGDEWIAGRSALHVAYMEGMLDERFSLS